MTDRDAYLISVHRDGVLTMAERSELTARLHADPAVRQAFMQAQRFDAQLRRAARSAVGSIPPARVVPGARWWLWRGHWRIGALAAAMLLAIAGGLIFAFPPTTEEVHLVSGSVLVDGRGVNTMPAGVAFAVGVLPVDVRWRDGSQASFSPGSEQLIRPMTVGNQHAVELHQGRVRFHALRSNTPLRVKTMVGNVQVQGSRCAIECPRSERARMEVDVEAGEAQVHVGNDHFVVRAGERRVFYDPGTTTRQGTVVSVLDQSETMILRTGRGEKDVEILTIDDSASVVIDGRPSQAEHIPLGSRVTVRLAPDGAIIALSACGDTLSGRIENIRESEGRLELTVTLARHRPITLLVDPLAELRIDHQASGWEGLRNGMKVKAVLTSDGSMIGDLDASSVSERGLPSATRAVIAPGSSRTRGINSLPQTNTTVE